MTADRRKVRPLDGKQIRDPFTKLRIPAEGAEVVTTGSYGTVIQKLINAGDLEDLEAAPVKNALREVGTDQRKAEGVTSAAASLAKKEV